MHRNSGTETRVDRVQSMTSLGLLADSVALAAMRYPEMTPAGEVALRHFDDVLAGLVDQANSREARVFVRRRSMSDLASVMVTAAAQSSGSENRAIPSFDQVRAHVQAMLSRSAEDVSVEAVRVLAEALSHATLVMAQDASRENGPSEWTRRTSLSYAA